MDQVTVIQKIVIWALPLIFAITLHEVAHGWVASFFGDQTARLSGRLTVNPIKHIDLIGTIVLPLLMLVYGGFVFGWAKPVPVDPRNMRHPRRDMALVALAGPLANLLMALFWGLIARLGMWANQLGNEWLGVPLIYMGVIGILLNVALAVLNLLPIPPLDGAKILTAVLPPRAAYQFNMLEPYGFLILILLLLSGVLSMLIGPPISFLNASIGSLFGLP